MKILHSADLHLDSLLPCQEPEQAQYLKEQLLSVPGKLSKLCRQEQCDLFLLAGDLFDGLWTKESFCALRDALEDCGAEVFISPGQQDAVTPDCPYLTELWPANVHIFTQPRIESRLLEELDCRVYGAGYRGPEHPIGPEGLQRRGNARYHIGVLHADPHRPDSGMATGLDYLALGHIHTTGQLRRGSTLCAWPGCPMGRSFDEPGIKGALVVTLENEPQTRFVPLDTPRFFAHTASVQELPRLLSQDDSRDFYKITLVGEDPQPSLPELYRQYSGFAHLELRDHRTDPDRLWGSRNPDTLEGIYFRQLKEAFDHADAETGQIIRLAAMLSQQILDGQEVILP